MVSASETAATPAASARSAAASTIAGATGPSYGQPNAVASVASMRTPAGSVALIDSSSANPASAERPALRALWASDTLTTNCRRSIPASRARWAPRALSTRAQRATDAPAVRAASSGASAIAGTRSGRTNDVSSRSRTPAPTSASNRASLSSVATTRSSCRPSRNVTSRTGGRWSRPLPRDDARCVQLVELGRRQAEQAGRAPRRCARRASGRDGGSHPASSVNRGTTPVIGTSQPWVDVTRWTIWRARYCGSASMSGAVKMRPAGTPLSVEHGEHVGARQRRRPRGDDGVELDHVRATGAVGGEAGDRRPAPAARWPLARRTKTLSALAATTTSAPSLVG